MKARDLMLGDWVRVTDDDTDESFVGRVSEFEQVDKRYYNVHVSDDEDSFGYPFDEDCIEPIPLTPEILEKNGWERDDERNFWIHDSGFAIEDGCDGRNRYWWRAGDIPVAPINYVHDLQHCLKVSCVQKEIVL